MEGCRAARLALTTAARGRAAGEVWTGEAGWLGRDGAAARCQCTHCWKSFSDPPSSSSSSSAVDRRRRTASEADSRDDTGRWQVVSPRWGGDGARQGRIPRGKGGGERGRGGGREGEGGWASRTFCGRQQATHTWRLIVP